MKINLETVIADMHMHSTRSDGRHSPKEMAEAIITKIEGTEFEGYAAAALTDHDSVEGVQEFIDTCGDKIIGVPGVEIAVYDQLISLFVSCPGRLHNQLL